MGCTGSEGASSCCDCFAKREASSESWPWCELSPRHRLLLFCLDGIDVVECVCVCVCDSERVSVCELYALF